MGVDILDLADAPTERAFVHLRQLLVESLDRRHDRTYPEELSADMEAVLRLLREHGPLRHARLMDKQFGLPRASGAEGEARWGRVGRAIATLVREGRIARPGPRLPYELA